MIFTWNINIKSTEQRIFELKKTIAQKWQLSSRPLSFDGAFKQKIPTNVLRNWIQSLVFSDCFAEAFGIFLIMSSDEIPVKTLLVDLLFGSQSRFLGPWRYSWNYKFIIYRSNQTAFYMTSSWHHSKKHLFWKLITLKNWLLQSK